MDSVGNAEHAATDWRTLPPREETKPQISPELNLTVQRCLKRIQRWPVPFHWAYADWREEAAAQGQSAAWIALEDYDASRGVPLGAFVYLRVMASVLTRYRQEWAYGTRCVAIDDGEATADPVEDAPGRNEDQAALRRALAPLPEADREILAQLFWKDCTEREVARSRHISQPAVNKRKWLILRHLHEQLDGAEKILRARLSKCESSHYSM